MVRGPDDSLDSPGRRGVGRRDAVGRPQDPGAGGAAVNAVLREAALFNDARSALRFAVCLEGSPERPAMNRLWDKMAGGRGLAGLDAAAQAGMILHILKGLGPLYFAALVADGAPHSRPCGCRRPCCSGKTIVPEWRDAIDTLCYEAVRLMPHAADPIDGHPVLRFDSVLPSGVAFELRAAIVRKLFGRGPSTLRRIAELTDYSEDTVQRHHRALLRWLRGGRAGSNQQAEEGVVSAAWREAESALKDAMIVTSD